MGIYRFVLAALVVLFHFGGLSWIVGRVAVFAFYCISGFLIFQVLDRIYLQESHGVWRFFSNRAVRLLPLYLLYMFLTLAFTQWAGVRAFNDPSTRSILGGIENEGLAELVLEDVTFEPDVAIDRSMPVLQFTPALIPQGWSIGVEASFYLIAPLVVFTTRRRTRWLAVWIAAGLAAFLWGVYAAGGDLDRFQTLVYKNAVASAVVFFVGGAFYYLRRKWGQPIRFEIVAALLLVWLAIVTVPALDLNTGSWSPGDFSEYLWLTLLLGALMALTRVRRLKSVDTSGGNLCYGIYLNHFLVAGLLLQLDVSRYIGAPGTLLFGSVVLIGSISLAFVTYRLCERPLDRLRERVRGEAVRESAPVVQISPRTPVAILAGVVCLALLANPVGLAVERVSAEAGPSRPVSAEFDIRWKPDVGEAARQRLEADLGLVGGVLVLRDPRKRTWSYRLLAPTRDRIRAIVTSTAVEDTARIDVERLEILE